MQSLKQNIRKIFILILLSGGAFFSNAQQASPASFNVQLTSTPAVELFTAGIRDEDSSSLKCKVWFMNPQEEKVKISIRSEMGYLFSKNLTDNWYAQVYDLGELEDGIYTITISKGKKSIEKKIKIMSDTYVVRKKLLF